MKKRSVFRHGLAVFLAAAMIFPQMTSFAGVIEGSRQSAFFASPSDAYYEEAADTESGPGAEESGPVVTESGPGAEETVRATSSDASKTEQAEKKASASDADFDEDGNLLDGEVHAEAEFEAAQPVRMMAAAPLAAAPLAAAPLAVQAGETSEWLSDYDYEADTDSGEVLLRGYVGEETGTITLPSAAMVDGAECRTALADGTIWDSLSGTLEEITFEEGVTAGGSLAGLFSGFTKLASVDMAGFDLTGVGTDAMFEGCTALTGMNIPETDHAVSLPGTFSYEAPDDTHCGSFREIPQGDTDGRRIVRVADRFPGDLAASLQTDGVKVSWSAYEGAAEYAVLRTDGDGNTLEAGRTSGTSWTDTGAASGNQYVYNLAAYNEAGILIREADGEGVSVTYLAAPQMSVPTNGRNGVRFSWSTVPGATQYRIYRAAGSGGAWEPLTDVGASADVSQMYEDQSVVSASGVWYAYSVTSLCKGGETESARNKGKAVRFLAAPEVTSANFTGSKVKVTWSTVDGGFKYRLYRKDPGGSGFERVMDVSDKSGAGSLSWVDSAIQTGKTYQYYVRCVNVEGTKPMSSYMNTVTVKTGTAVTGVSLNYTAKTISIGDTLKLTAAVAPAGASYKAVTWASKNPKAATVDSRGSVKAVASGTATITVTTKDRGYTASCKVTVRPNYTISYVLNGGTNSASNPTVYNAASGTITLQAATRKGYAFGGWYTSSACTTKVTKISSGSTGNRTFYAKWTPYNYSITYVLNGGTNNSANPSAYKITSEVILKSPARKGYTFAGWYSDSAFKTRAYRIWKGTWGKKTFYAKWTPVKYKVAFDANGGSVECVSGNPKGTMSAMTCSYGTTYTLTSNAFTNSGYTFRGWNTKADGTGTSYANRAKITNLAATAKTVTLYAQWKIPAPENLVISRYNESTNELEYDYVNGADGYEIYRSTSPDRDFSLIDDTNMIGYFDEDVVSGTTYYYRIRAYEVLSSGKKTYGAFAEGSVRTAYAPEYKLEKTSYTTGKDAEYYTLTFKNTGSGEMHFIDTSEGGYNYNAIEYQSEKGGPKYKLRSHVVSDITLAPGESGNVVYKCDGTYYIGTKVTSYPYFYFAMVYDDCGYSDPIE